MKIFYWALIILFIAEGIGIATGNIDITTFRASTLAFTSAILVIFVYSYRFEDKTK